MAPPQSPPPREIAFDRVQRFLERDFLPPSPSDWINVPDLNGLVPALAFAFFESDAAPNRWTDAHLDLGTSRLEVGANMVRSATEGLGAQPLNPWEFACLFKEACEVVSTAHPPTPSMWSPRA